MPYCLENLGIDFPSEFPIPLMTMTRTRRIYPRGPGVSSAVLEAGQRFGEMGQRRRLPDHLHRSQAERLLHLVLVGMTGEDHDGKLRVAGADAGERGQAAQAWHHEVHEDAIDLGRLQELDRLRRV